MLRSCCCCRFGKESEPLQVVIVCGKNAAVKQKLEAHRVPDNVSVKILGFVKNMDEWMGAVDVIVTKVRLAMVVLLVLSLYRCLPTTDVTKKSGFCDILACVDRCS